jgi:hypothetical protein
MEPLGRLLVADLSYVGKIENKGSFENFYESRFVDIEFSLRNQEEIDRDHKQRAQSFWQLLT